MGLRWPQRTSHVGQAQSAFRDLAEGKHQSPIDIREAKAADLPPIEFKYQSSPLRVIDNGHTVQVDYAPGQHHRRRRSNLRVEPVPFPPPKREPSQW